MAENRIVFGVQKFRCSKGHEWERWPWEASLAVTNAGESFTICPFCLMEFAKSYFGKVEKVFDGGADEPVIKEPANG